MRLACAVLFAACSSPVAQLPAHTAAGPSAPPAPALPPVAELHGAWIETVATRDPVRIARLLAPPFDVYYDDGTSGRAVPDCERWRRTVQPVTTLAERDELARCIAATVHHQAPVPRSLFDRGGDPTHAIGLVPLELLRDLVDEPVRESLVPLSADHAFVHGDRRSSSDYDFTLALSRDRRITFLALTSHPGC